jgi:hypothetical protein
MMKKNLYVLIGFILCFASIVAKAEAVTFNFPGSFASIGEIKDIKSLKIEDLPDGGTKWTLFGVDVSGKQESVSAIFNGLNHSRDFSVFNLRMLAANSHGTLTQFRAVDAVPEPSMGLMLLAGCLILGFWTKKRAASINKIGFFSCTQFILVCYSITSLC